MSLQRIDDHAQLVTDDETGLPLAVVVEVAHYHMLLGAALELETIKAYVATMTRIEGIQQSRAIEEAVRQMTPQPVHQQEQPRRRRRRDNIR